MAILFQHEQLLTFAQAAKLLPRRRAGRKPHVSTLYRWANRGVRGIVLETIRIGGTTCTSEEALQRFFDQLGNAPDVRPVSSASRKEKISEADEFLKDQRF